MIKKQKYQWRAILLVLLGAGIIFMVYGLKPKNQSEENVYTKKEMKEAIIYYNQSKEFNRALVLANKYILIYPADIEGWTHRGFAYFGLGNCAEATSNFTHASMNGDESPSRLLTFVLNNEICKN